MPASSVDVDTNEDDYYSILNLDRPRSVNSHDVSKDDIKAAYHRTLLMYHPDKMKESTFKTVLGQNKNVTLPCRSVYSIDQIMQAYQTLADPTQRAAYNKSLLKEPSRAMQQSSQIGGHLGVEIFDLEELQYNEEEQTWHQVCRCGNNEGYVLTESELEKESGEGELYVGCKGCSLFIKVLFSVEEENTEV